MMGRFPWKTGSQFWKKLTMNLQGKNQESAYPDIEIFNYRKHVEDLFREKDKDHNGKLSWEEFCGEKTPTEKAFGIMDVDNNGRVSKEVRRHTDL